VTLYSPLAQLASPRPRWAGAGADIHGTWWRGEAGFGSGGERKRCGSPMAKRRLELRASEEGVAVACFDGGRGWCGFSGEAAWLGRHSSGGAVASPDGRMAVVM
jgi:hypothetical protein